MNARSALAVIVIGVAFGCGGGERRSGDKPAERPVSDGPDCADYASRLASSLRAVPRDQDLPPLSWRDGPVLQGKRRRLEDNGGHLIWFDREFVEMADVPEKLRHARLPTWFAEHIADLYGRAPVRVISVLADRSALAQQLVTVVDAIAAAERSLDTTLEIRWLVKIPKSEFRPYSLPPRTPPWVRELVDRYYLPDKELESALERSAPNCQKARHVAKEIIDHGEFLEASRETNGTRLVQELETCRCEGLDFDAFEGLVLGLSAHVSPYGYVVLATSGAGVKTVTVPKDATIEDLAVAWPRDVDEPVFVKLK